MGENCSTYESSLWCGLENILFYLLFILFIYFIYLFIYFLIMHTTTQALVGIANRLKPIALAVLHFFFRFLYLFLPPFEGNCGTTTSCSTTSQQGIVAVSKWNISLYDRSSLINCRTVVHAHPSNIVVEIDCDIWYKHKLNTIAAVREKRIEVNTYSIWCLLKQNGKHDMLHKNA